MAFSQRSILTQPTRIQFVPDPHAIGIGTPNFTRYSDAVAEFVDNSIQACADVRVESTIHVGIYLQSSKGFLVISDHGQGMDEGGLRNFATFALSKEFRGERPRNETDRTFIGKFGVGAKQGGFFLGDRIRTLTKSHLAQERDPWLCFTLDSEELIQRQRNHENVYEGYITPFHDLPSVLSEDEREYADLVNDLRIHQQHDSDQGAIFIIRLHAHVAEHFRKNQNYQLFERELADIHYFHLHPEQRPSHQTGRRLTTASQHQHHIRHFEVQFKVNRPGHQYSSNFSQVQSFPLQCFANAKASLPFMLTVPVADNRSFDITGLVQYFPFQEGQETRPLLLDLNSEDDFGSGAIFRIFWQDRSLPEAKVSNLPFFPTQRGELSKLVDGGVSAKWRSRLVVLLFLDWDFQNISNNKLKITQADFETQLMTLKNAITYHPSTLKKDFERWLEETSKNFDHEFRFSDRLVDLIETRYMIFRKVHVLGRGGEYSSGSRVVITNTQTKEKIFGLIQDFVVREHLPLSEVSYTGTGFVRYKRIPEPLFGDKVFEAGLSKIELSQVTTAEITNYQVESKPTKIELYLVEADKKPTAVSHSTPLRCSVRYNFGVRLSRGKNKDTFCPDKAKDFVYGVSLALESAPDVELARCSILTSNEVDNTNSSSTSKTKLKLIVLPEISFSVSGKVSLIVRVMSNDFTQQILQETVALRCVTTAPKRFQASFVGYDRAPFVRLGTGLPALSLEVYDADNNLINYEGEILVTATCDSLKMIGTDYRRTANGRMRVPDSHWTLQPKAQRTHLFEVSSDEGVGIGSRIVSLTFNASVRTNSTVNSQLSQAEGNWKLVGRCTVDVELFPGAPHSLTVLQPADRISIKGGERLPELTIGCLDLWSNPTAPASALNDPSWSVCLGSGPLVVEPSSVIMGNDVVTRGSQRSQQHAISSSQSQVSRVFLVGSSGQAKLRHLSCSDIPLIVTEKTQEFVLQETQSRNRMAEILSLIITILPQSSPEKLQLIYEETVIDERFEFPVQAGGVVRGIGFRVLDEQSRVLNLEPYRPNSHLTIALYPEGKADHAKRRAISLPDADFINAVKAPKTKGIHYMEVSFTFAGLPPLLEVVAIRVLPNVPHSWKIKTSPHLEEGLRLQDAADLASKIEYVYCVDEFDNVTMLASEVALLQDLRMRRLASTQQNNASQIPLTAAFFSQQLSTQHQRQKPVLRIRRANANGTGKEDDTGETVLQLVRHLAIEREEQDQPESMNSLSNELQMLEADIQVRYLLPAASYISGFPPESTLHITADSAPESGLEDIAEHTITTFIVGGEPSGLKLFSLSYEFANASQDVFVVDVSEFETIEDLECSIVDEHGGLAASLWTRKSNVAVYDCSDPENEKLVFSKKNIRKNPFVLDDFRICVAEMIAQEKRSQFTLKISVSCPGGGGSREVRDVHTTLQISILQSCHVSRLQIFIPTSNSQQSSATIVDIKQRDDDTCEDIFSLKVIAGQPLPKIAVGLITADGSAFVPEKSSLKVSLSPNSCRESVSLLDFPADSEADMVRQFAIEFLISIKNFNNKHITGKYNLEIRYEENRAKLASLPVEIRKRIAKLQIVVLPASLEILQLDERRISRDVLHSSLDKERCFATSLTATMRDSFRNAIPVHDDMFLVSRIIPAINNGNTNVVAEDLSLNKMYHAAMASGEISGSNNLLIGPPLECENFDLNQELGLIYDPNENINYDDDGLESSQMMHSQIAFSQIVNSQLAGVKRSQPSTNSTPNKARKLSTDGFASNHNDLRVSLATFFNTAGMAVAQRKGCHLGFVFHNLRLRNDNASSNNSSNNSNALLSRFADGQYILQFLLVRIVTNSTSTTENDVFQILHTQEIEFQYCSAATVDFRSRQIVSTGERAQAELDDYRTLREQIRELSDEFHNLLEEINSRVTDAYGQDQSLSLSHNPSSSEFLSLTDVVKDEIQRLEQEVPRPPVRQTKFLRQRLPEEAIGYVVDLAYVVDKRDAEILSWAAGNWIDTIVVQREAVAVDLYQRQQRRAWAYETAGIAVTTSNNSNASENGRRPQLPSLVQIALEIGGRPRYMLDVLQFDSGREDLRHKLFTNVFQNFILIDTLEQALELRRSLRNKGAPRIPTIYTLSGDRIPSSGQLDPTNRIPNEISAIFGSQDPRLLPKYQSLQKLLVDIEKVKTLRINLTELENRTEGFDVQELEQQVRAAEVERRRLRM